MRYQARWVGAWAAAPMGNSYNPGQVSATNSTHRNIAHRSAGGTHASGEERWEGNREPRGRMNRISLRRSKI